MTWRGHRRAALCARPSLSIGGAGEASTRPLPNAIPAGAPYARTRRCQQPASRIAHLTPEAVSSQRAPRGCPPGQCWDRTNSPIRRLCSQHCRGRHPAGGTKKAPRRSRHGRACHFRRFCGSSVASRLHAWSQTSSEVATAGSASGSHRAGCQRLCPTTTHIRRAGGCAPTYWVRGRSVSLYLCASVVCLGRRGFCVHLCDLWARGSF
jgi:hypothetical protein